MILQMLNTKNIWCCVFTAVLLYITGCSENKASGTTLDSTVTGQQALASTKDIITANKEITAAKLQLQDGDMVTRSDDDFESATLQNFSNTDRSYSHSGIAFKEGDDFYIYHAITGAENPSGKYRRDIFDSFVNPLRKTGFGIFRYQLNEKEKDEFHNIMQTNFKNAVPFDLTFDLNSNDSLYCSEMIYKALKKCTHNRILLPTSKLYNFKPKIFGFQYRKLLLKEFEYVSIDNLYLNSFCKEIKRVSYK